MFCKVTLIGRLSKEVEPAKAQGAMAFSVAYDNGKDKSGEKISCFVDCVTFGKTAQNAKLYLKKGDLIYIDGNLSVTTYEGKDGIKRKGVSILVNMFRILSPRDTAKKAFKQVKESPRVDVDMPAGDIDGEIPF